MAGSEQLRASLINIRWLQEYKGGRGGETVWREWREGRGKRESREETEGRA